MNQVNKWTCIDTRNVNHRDNQVTRHTPFYNGAEEIKEQYMRIYGFDYKKRAVLQMILSLRRFVKTLCTSDAEACAWIAREIL